MRIRRARESDIEGIAETVVEAWHWAYEGVVSDELLAEQQVGPRVERMRLAWNPDALCLVAVDDEDRVHGLAREHQPPTLADYDSEIGSLYVRPTVARMGCGRALLSAMVQEFLGRGGRSLCIHTLRDNRIGRAFYEKQGGKLVGEDDWRGYPAVWYGWEDMQVQVPATDR